MKGSLNSDNPQFHQYQQSNNPLSPQIVEHKENTSQHMMLEIITGIGL